MIAKNAPRPLNYVAAKAVRKIVHEEQLRASELKYVDATPLAAQTITTSMSTVMMSAISAGTSVNGRVGELVTMSKVEFRLAFVTGDATQTLRMLILIDTQPNGAAFVQTDLFENASDPLSAINWQYKRRFTILKDKTFTLDTYNPTCAVTGTVKVKADTKYNGTSNSIANITKNALYFVFVSDSGAVPQPTVSGNIRLFFRDL